MEARVVEKLDTKLEDAWPVFADFKGLSDMLPPGATMEIDGEGVGAIRTVTTPDGGTVKERLEALDHDNNQFSYAVINDDSPLPFTDYLATVKLRETSPTSCEVDWSSNFQSAGAMAEADLTKMIEGMYRGVIRQLATKCPAA